MKNFYKSLTLALICCASATIASAQEQKSTDSPQIDNEKSIFINGSTINKEGGEGINIEIFNMSGQKIYQGTYPATIDKSGVFFIKEEGKAAVKIVK